MDSGGCIFLTGAPEAHHLQWNEDSLVGTFEPATIRFLGETDSLFQSDTQSSGHATIKWRALSIPNDSIAAGEAIENEEAPRTQFLSFEEASQQGDNLPFLEYSLACLDNLHPSQLAGVDTTTAMPSTFPSFSTSTDMSSLDDNTSFAAATKSLPHEDMLLLRTDYVGNAARQHGNITDLKQIPPASHIIRMQPQTITITIMAAVISISPVRTVRLRKGGQKDIIEILLGDETRAGFTVTFWLAPTEHQHEETDNMRDVLHRLRAGSVVLMHNVALSAYNGCTYGQSLNQRFSRNRTTLEAIHDGKKLDVVSNAKYRLVARWRDQFLRIGETARKSRPEMETSEDGLPPDSQSST